MKGYHSLKQFVQDYKLYKTAKKVDPGRDAGETVTSFLRKRINARLKCASKQFKDILKKNNYSKDDLVLIATHDYMDDIHALEHFMKACFEKNYINHLSYK